MRYGIPAVASMVMAAIVSQLGCKDKSVDPPIKNPREYTWTVKEISHPPNASFPFQVLATDVWGSSPRDVYVTFISGAVAQYKLFHFNGSEWREVNLSGFSYIGFNQFPFDFNSVKGFSSSDIWVVGERLYSNPNPPPNYLDSTLIIHFNGSTWSEVPVNIRERGLRSIGAISPTDIWFGGLNGTLYHYNGVNVKLDSLGAITSNLQGHNYIIGAFAGLSSNDVFAFFNDFTTGYFHFLKRTGGIWQELDSQFATQTSLWLSPSGKLFSTFYGYGLYTWSGQAPWTPFYTEGNASVRAYGTAEDNIFVTGQRGGLYHYNGSDWYKFANLESNSIDFRAIWTDGKEVFVIGTDYFKSYIFHGK